jgi:hypothetical protein
VGKSALANELDAGGRAIETVVVGRTVEPVILGWDAAGSVAGCGMIANGRVCRAEVPSAVNVRHARGGIAIAVVPCASAWIVEAGILVQCVRGGMGCDHVCPPGHASCVVRACSADAAVIARISDIRFAILVPLAHGVNNFTDADARVVAFCFVLEAGDGAVISCAVVEKKAGSGWFAARIRASGVSRLSAGAISSPVALANFMFALVLVGKRGTNAAHAKGVGMSKAAALFARPARSRGLFGERKLIPLADESDLGNKFVSELLAAELFDDRLAHERGLAVNLDVDSYNHSS